MSTPTTDRAAIVLQQIDARIAAIAGNWPDESRALRCLRTAIGSLRAIHIAASNEADSEFALKTLANLCDQWEAGKQRHAN
jgi:hypothetical protein